MTCERLYHKHDIDELNTYFVNGEVVREYDATW